MTRVFTVAENGWLEALELVPLLLLETGTFGDKKWKEIFSRYYIFLLSGYFSSKRKGHVHRNFDKISFLISTRIQHKVVLLVMLTAFAIVITQFLAIKL